MTNIQSSAALLHALGAGDLASADAALDAGANIDAVTAGGMTAYRHAARRGFTEVAEHLIARGADTTVSDRDELAIALCAQDLETRVLDDASATVTEVLRAHGARHDHRA